MAISAWFKSLIVQGTDATSVLCNRLSALLLQPGGRKRRLWHQEPCATGRAGPGRDRGAWWGREKGGPSVTWAGRQLGGFGSCSEDAVSDCVESLERTDSVLGQFRRKTWRARGDAFPLPTSPPARGNNHTKAWLERRISQVLLDAVYLRTAAFSRIGGHGVGREHPPDPRRALPVPRPRAQARGGWRQPPNPRSLPGCQNIHQRIQQSGNGWDNMDLRKICVHTTSAQDGSN